MEVNAPAPAPRASRKQRRAAALAQASPAEIAARKARAKHAALVKRARIDQAAFVEYVLRNESDGTVIRNAPHHEEWHDFLSLNDRAVLFAPVEHGKTQQVAIGAVLFRLGQNPNARLALISNTSRQAEKLLGAIRLHIERNPRLKEVFPELRRSELSGDPWHTTALTVHRTTIAKDPSIQALGVGGPLVGSRLDGAVLDDVLDFENTRTPEQRTKLVDWFDSTVSTRLLEGAFCWVIGTPWHPDDLLHVLASRPGWEAKKWRSVHNPEAPPAEWRTLWPAQFSPERLQKIQAGSTALNFARKYLCEVRSSETARFKRQWFEDAAARGKRWGPFRAAPVTAGQAWPCFTGVDLGVGETDGHDLTCLFTIALEPLTGRRVVCEILSGRWSGPDIVEKIFDANRRFGSIVVVESNGAQKFIQQFASGRQVPIRPFFTSAQNKYDEHFGVESLAVELANGQWVIPSHEGTMGSATGEATAWMSEAELYHPDSHTGDRLMASWFAREAARNYGPKVFGRSDVQQR